MNSSRIIPSTIFADLYQNDPYGRIRIIDLYQYTMRKMWYHHSRMGLSLYDSIGQGYIRESVNIRLHFYVDDQSTIPFVMQGSRRLYLRIDTYDESISATTGNIL
jgi:hypothetical protein